MTRTIQNPIIRGFNPDPSILRMGDDYYIVTSTFEWFPGYQIHHSRDLRHWQLVARPLNRVSQLDMLGVPDSCGVWAPCLTYHEGVFYLLFTNVRSFDGAWKDMPNYLVMTDDILGDWSDPIYLNASGFDASFFHDDDGRTWLTNMLMDHRDNKFFGGIVLQEYDKKQQKLVGDIHYIFAGTELGRTEGPHIYKRNGYYYLLVAEGGTGYHHAMTLARSRQITGPYEVHPQNPILTAKNNPDLYLQKTGHGDLVQTQDGEWYAVFLASTPQTRYGRCILGRETAIEKVKWCHDDWLYLTCGGNEPRADVEAPNLPDYCFEPIPTRLDFNTKEINIHFQSLRVPMTDDWVNLTDRPGYLRLYGRQSLSSTFQQSLIARRVQAHHIETATCVEFEPITFQQMAGLVCYYNTYHYHYLHIYGNDDGTKKYVGIITCDKYNTVGPFAQVDVTGIARIYLKADFIGYDLQFYYAIEEGEWQNIGPILDGSILSDDYVKDVHVRYRPCFTGAFVGLCCQDLSGQGLHADFDWFEYRELTYYRQA